ncbi:MAG: sensor histidine kinase [Lachnospiraceae bacterium]|nr:sensor histidine kinase [Lachnospiraceae bacterium]
MKKFKNAKYKNAKFRTKIIITFLLVFMTASFFSGIAYYTYSNRDIFRNYRDNSYDMILQLDRQVSEEFTNLGSRIDACCNNPTFSEPVKAFLNSGKMKADAVLSGNMADSLLELSMSDELVTSVYLYMNKCLFSDYTQIPVSGVRYEDTEMYRHFVYYPSESVAWFSAMENPLFLETNPIIPVVYRRTIDGESVFFIVNISQPALKAYLEDSYSSFERIFVVDRENREIINCDGMSEQVLSETKYNVLKNRVALFNKVKIDHVQYMVTSTSMRGSEWHIYALTSVNSLTPSTRHLYLFIITIVLISITLGISAIWLFARELTKPLEQLACHMDHTVSNEMKTKFEYQYQDEIGILGQSYNEMLDEIRALIESLNIHIEALREEKEHVKYIQKQKRKAEIAALQAQINPHFLYNTLNMITWQAVEQGASKISIISNALGKYFRISLSRGNEVISICEEVEHVKSYLEIQKIRYKSKLTYEIDISQDIMELFTVKLILQPLVENALYHGIKEKDGVGMISIYAGKGEDEVSGRFVEIIVEDDGLGIDEDTLLLLNDRLEKGIVDSSSGFGIYNVNNRLHLYFGSNFGLKLESDKGIGTRSILRFPLCRTKEEIADVSDCDSGR